MEYIWGFGGIEINQKTYDYVTGQVKYQKEYFLDVEKDTGEIIRRFKGWRAFIYFDDLIICNSTDTNFVLDLIQTINYIEKNNLTYQIKPRFDNTPDAKNLIFYDMLLESDLFEINDIAKNGKAQTIPQLVFKSKTLLDEISNLISSDELDFLVDDLGNYMITDDSSYLIIN